MRDAVVNRAQRRGVPNLPDDMPACDLELSDDDPFVIASHARRS